MEQVLSDSQINNLAKQAQNDRQSIEILYKYFYPLVYRYIRKSLHSNEDAEDVVTQIFLKMVHKMHIFSEHKGHFRFWLFRVAKNTLFDFLRKQRNSRTELLDEESKDSSMISHQSFESDFEQEITIQGLKELISQLPPAYSEVIRLRYFADLSNKEIAHTLEIGEKTVSSNLSRGMDKLRELATRSIS